MTCVICPTCGAACSIGGETTRYFIPPKDENKSIVDLQRQIAAATTQINDLTAIKDGLMAGQIELQRQLAKANALLAVRIQESNEWEALARDRQEEIEAMRPMVERYRWLRSNDQAPSITGIWYGDFTLDKAIDDARKHQ